MGIDILALTFYAAILMIVDPSKALSYSIAATAIGAVVTWATGARHFHLAFRWFRSHALQGIYLGILVALFCMLPFALGSMVSHSKPALLAELPGVLAGSPVVFLWFWAFAAVKTRFQERRIARLVDQRLAEMNGGNGPQGTPGNG
jgi:hypothetical protein